MRAYPIKFWRAGSSIFGVSIEFSGLNYDSVIVFDNIFDRIQRSARGSCLR